MHGRRYTSGLHSESAKVCEVTEPNVTASVDGCNALCG